MKRIPALILALCLLLSLAGCSGKTASDGEVEGKVLVVYFSCSGNTGRLAGHIADILDADLYEIVPEEPYTSADLETNDPDSRSSLERDDETVRPAISGAVENMEDYAIVFLGYPIWWGEAPKILYTFLESYDFSGKTVIPFCTSGSSGIGSSATHLHQSTAGSPHWLDGVRFSSGAARQTVVEWLKELPVKIPE